MPPPKLSDTENGEERLRERGENKRQEAVMHAREEREEEESGLIALPGARAASFTQPWAQIVYAVRIHATHFHFRYGISHLVPWKISLS